MQNELRHSLDFNEWTLYSSALQTSDSCLICESGELKIEETDRIENPKSSKKEAICRSFLDPFPLTHPMAFKENEIKDFYSSYKAHGWSELIIESSEHGTDFASFSTEQIKDVLKLLQKRSSDIERREGVEAVCIIKDNNGAEFQHSYSRIFSLPFIPKTLRDKVNNFRSYLTEKGRCFYCDFIENEKKSSRVIFENEEFIGFVPFSQRLNFEVLVAPKKHLTKLGEIEDYSLFSLADAIRNILKMMSGSVNPFIYSIFYYQKPINEKDFHFHISLSQKMIHHPAEEGYGVLVHRALPDDVAKMLKSKG